MREKIDGHKTEKPETRQETRRKQKDGTNKTVVHSREVVTICVTDAGGKRLANGPLVTVASPSPNSRLVKRRADKHSSGKSDLHAFYN